MRAAGRRRATESIAPDRRPPPPTPTNNADNWQFLSTPAPGRDSDASFCSSRPSTASVGRHPAALPNISDRSYQMSALRTINSYLESQSLPFSLKHPLPSAKDITETLKFLVRRLGFDSQKIDEDINLALKFLKCPFKLTKSALRAPGTPHSWPNLLAVIHWLVQIIRYKEYMLNPPASFEEDKEFMYTIDSYSLYIKGADEGVEELDAGIMKQLGDWKEVQMENVKGLTESVKELEGILEGLKTGPSQKEKSEQEKAMLEKDVMKFHMLIETLNSNLVELQKKLEEKKKALEEKVEERKRICEENDELKKKIEEQGINLRAAERMRRELQAMERDIEETEAARNGWEEKNWELHSEIGHKLKELEQMMMQANPAIRRLKLGNGFQYLLNAQGSTPYEVLGLNTKSILKPALATFAEEIERSSMEKNDESATLRKQLGESAAKIEEKRNQIAAVQSSNTKVEEQLISMRNGAHDYASRNVTEARKMAAEVDMEAQKLSVSETEVAQFLQTSKAELQETTNHMDEEVKMCAKELFDLIDSVSAFKEHTGAQIAWMRNDLLDTAGAIADIYKGYRPQQASVVPESSS